MSKGDIEGAQSEHRPMRLVAAIGAFALLLLIPSAASATLLPETIKENMTLTPAGNPYTGTSTIDRA